MGEVPFLIYELEDEDAVAAFWEAASSAKEYKDESERRVCPDDGKLSLSRKLGMEWLSSKGGTIAFIGPTPTKKVEHE